MHARRGYNLESALLISTHKHIAGKEGQGEDFLAIPPAAYRFVERKKDFKAFEFQHVGNILLVLVARIKSPPVRRTGRELRIWQLDNQTDTPLSNMKQGLEQHLTPAET